jgi:hypothetical protein
MSCATFSKSLILKFQLREYRPCAEKQVENPVGKFCYRYCKQYKFLSKKCKEWDQDVQDLTDPETFKKFRAANFTLRAEQ